jgi:hypothetical protein
MGLHDISFQSDACQLKMGGTTFRFSTTFRKASNMIEPNCWQRVLTFVVPINVDYCTIFLFQMTFCLLFELPPFD